MSKKQGRSRSLVRESDVADILSNWSDAQENTNVCSLIDMYIYIYICVYAPIHSFEPIGCVAFSSQDAWPVFELCVSTCSWLGSLASQKVSRLERPKRMIYYDGFHVLSMSTAKGSLNNTVLCFCWTWCSPATLVFLWHPFLQSLKWNWLLQFDLKLLLCFSKWPPSLRTVCILSWGIVPLQAVAMRVPWLNRTVLIGEVASNFQTLQRGKDRGLLSISCLVRVFGVF